jgi:hypothetical protein
MPQSLFDPCFDSVDSRSRRQSRTVFTHERCELVSSSAFDGRSPARSPHRIEAVVNSVLVGLSQIVAK